MNQLIKPRLIVIMLLLLVSMVSLAEAQRPRFKSNGTSAPAADQDILKLISTFEKDKCAVLEVSQEMFEILANDDRASEEIKETLSQIDHLVYLNCFGMVKGKESTTFNLTREFKDKAADYEFKLLMRSETGLSSNHFYKRKNKDLNEYILVTNVTIQYIATELNIMSIRDLKDILEMAGDAGDL